MTYARISAVFTWAYAAGFGIPAIWVSVYLRREGRLPTFLDLFPMYGGPWYSRFSEGPFIGLLISFLVLSLVASWAAWLVWNGSRTGAIISFALLPIEAVFWLGFALPIPWLFGIARAVFLALAWKSLS